MSVEPPYLQNIEAGFAEMTRLLDIGSAQSTLRAIRIARYYARSPEHWDVALIAKIRQHVYLRLRHPMKLLDPTAFSDYWDKVPLNVPVSHDKPIGQILRLHRNGYPLRNTDV